MCLLRREIQINVTWGLCWLIIARHHRFRVPITKFSVEKQSFESLQYQRGRADSHQEEGEMMRKYFRILQMQEISVSKRVLNLMHLGKTSSRLLISHGELFDLYLRQSNSSRFLGSDTLINVFTKSMMIVEGIRRGIKSFCQLLTVQRLSSSVCVQR